MTYHDYPTSTLLGSHVVFLTTCLKDLKDSNQKLAKTSKVLEEMKNTTAAVIENFKNELKVVKQDVQSSKSKIGDLTTELTVVKQDVQSSKSKIGDLTTELTALQNWIGYADVKSLPTYFYAQKTGPFGTSGVPIPFESETLNIGGAMNITTGKFTAPRKGVYFFAFNGVSILNQYGFVNLDLMVNGVQIGRAQCDSKVSGGEWETLTLQSTIELKAGDLVWLQILNLQGAFLQDQNPGHLTHFSGWMLQEYLSL
ncbi:C1q and tumor necrosis factor-related protein-like protein 3 [Daphnia pulex]|uniref:C1q and tumor necrosis factor-related protein-like protein 3 n=1 Tax=Daphnia pulex TaxID=6669 RepID=E9HRS4_DAPPU|nr:C1q and tumor necrosis factor-related protein-like protein 3 [Daphnia pulex]|eukprot:EFX65567.1 C1q and tumor necrosis factor-related protein-like protein 3 [Daphnia pulex]